jgi:hypothetical protein
MSENVMKQETVAAICQVNARQVQRSWNCYC